VFFFGFRSKRSFFLPFLVVGLGTLWTIGIMALVGFNLSLVSLMVPPLVLVLGSSYSIHVLTQYYATPSRTPRTRVDPGVGHQDCPDRLPRGRNHGLRIPGASHRGHQADQGIRISASIGIVFCAILALFVFPAILSLLPRRASAIASGSRAARGTAIVRSSRWVMKWRYLVLGVVALIALGFALTIRGVRYDTNYMSYFRTREAAVEDTRFVIRKFGGYLTVRLTLTAPEGRQGYFLDPAVLRKVAELEERLAANPDVSYISSFTAYLRAFNERWTARTRYPSPGRPVLALSRIFRGAMATQTGRELVGELADDSFTRLTLVMRVFDSRRANLMYEDRLSAFAEEPASSPWR